MKNTAIEQLVANYGMLVAYRDEVVVEAFVDREHVERFHITSKKMLIRTHFLRSFGLRIERAVSHFGKPPRTTHIMVLDGEEFLVWHRRTDETDRVAVSNVVRTLDLIVPALLIGTLPAELSNAEAVVSTPAEGDSVSNVVEISVGAARATRITYYKQSHLIHRISRTRALGPFFSAMTENRYPNEQVCSVDEWSLIECDVGFAASCIHSLVPTFE